jgi:hypothetical protein
MRIIFKKSTKAVWITGFVENKFFIDPLVLQKGKDPLVEPRGEDQMVKTHIFITHVF